MKSVKNSAWFCLWLSVATRMGTSAIADGGRHDGLRSPLLSSLDRLKVRP